MDKGKFRALRKAAGLTQTKVAEAIGCHLTTVQRWEAGEVPIPHHGALIIRLLEEISRCNSLERRGLKTVLPALKMISRSEEP